jgi:hypothetical protein
MNILTRFSRRTLLRSAGASLLLAPLLRAEVARAQNTTIRRFVTLFHPNGSMYLGNSSPHTTASGFSLGNYYQALERHRENTIALTGMRIGGDPYGSQAPDEGGHASGGWGCLTCTSSNNTHQATGPSIDQFIARKLQEQQLAPTARAPVFRVGPGGGGWANYFEAAGRPISALTSPTQAYGNLFAGFTPGPGSTATRAAALIARKRSVLDSAWADCKGQLSVLPSEGRTMLDYHCERIREVERALQAPPPVSTCTPPEAALTAVANLNPATAANYPALTDFFFKLMATAFTCDIVRVASFAFGQTAARFGAPWLNAPVLSSVNTGEMNVNDHHSHTHAGTEQSVGLFMNWYAQKYAGLLDLFKEVQPDGTRLMDSTLAHWTTEYGKGPAHDTWGAVMFIFANPTMFRTNRLLEYPVTHFQPTSPEGKQEGQRHHAMMVSMIQAMGITGVTQFGDPQGGSGPLAALT